MRILLVNKFLHPKGGAETYMLKLGAHLQARGHQVQYFGMDSPDRTVGNRVNAYTSPMDFHGGDLLTRLSYPIRTIYSREARQKLRLVLEDFCPDAVHLNNFNYQLTPSVILEICRWRERSGRSCRILYTAHDYQLVCPNHMCRNPNTGALCEQCLGGGFAACITGRCIHGSRLKSLVGTLEAMIWNRAGVYRHMDRIICCSDFMRSRLDSDPVLRKRTMVLRNFADAVPGTKAPGGAYVLYFGRYTREKGVETLAEAARALPHIPFVFAGDGPLAQMLEGIPNIRNVGFRRGEALEKLIREARFSVCPSQWYENCPMSVVESLALGTPVLGADIGGIPELIRPGENGALFQSGNSEDLKEKLELLWQRACPGPVSLNGDVPTIAQYCMELERYYCGEREALQCQEN